jgi:hypothetical protein
MYYTRGESCRLLLKIRPQWKSEVSSKCLFWLTFEFLSEIPAVFEDLLVICAAKSRYTAAAASEHGRVPPVGLSRAPPTAVSHGKAAAGVWCNVCRVSDAAQPQAPAAQVLDTNMQTCFHRCPVMMILLLFLQKQNDSRHCVDAQLTFISFIRKHIHTRTQINIFIDIRTHKYTQVHVRSFTVVPTITGTHMHTRTYTYIHMRTHAHTCRLIHKRARVMVANRQVQPQVLTFFTER